MKRLAIVMFGAALAVSCSNSKPAAARASSLVTQTDAQRVLGADARLAQDREGPSESAPGARERVCEYIGPDRTTLMVVVVTAPNEESAKKLFVDAKTGDEGSGRHAEDENAAGDESYFVRSGGGQRITVRKAAHLIAIEARVPPGVDVVEEFKRLATRIANQLEPPTPQK